MRIQEVGLDAHIWECGSEHRAGFRMFCRMKSELLLFVTLILGQPYGGGAALGPGDYTYALSTFARVDAATR